MIKEKQKKQLIESLKKTLGNITMSCKNAGIGRGTFYNLLEKDADSEGFNFSGACIDVGLTVRECLIWNKNALVLGRQDYQWKHEPCLYGLKDGGSHKWYSDRSQTTVLEFKKPLRNGEHPTMKPVELFSYLIKNSTKVNDIVLDTFGGSGTTIIACEQLNRKCYTMFIN